MTRVAKSSVRVLPGCVVYVEGESHGAGQVIDLPAVEARALLEQGVVEKA